jgi:hypothetical protein
MINKRIVILKALCDACGAKLSHEDQHNADRTPSATHYGELTNHFGYGSPLDGIDDPTGKLHLCEACYTKAFKALGISIGYRDTPWNLRVGTACFNIADDKPVSPDADDFREAYWAPLWSCKFCDWTLGGRGYSMPRHQCENVNRIMGVRQDSCGICTLTPPIDGEPSHYDPVYSEREDAWVHYKYQGHDSVPCKASPIALELMRKGERVDPEWKAKMDASERAI